MQAGSPRPAAIAILAPLIIIFETLLVFAKSKPSHCAFYYFSTRLVASSGFTSPLGRQKLLPKPHLSLRDSCKVEASGSLVNLSHVRSFFVLHSSKDDEDDGYFNYGSSKDDDDEEFMKSATIGGNFFSNQQSNSGPPSADANTKMPPSSQIPPDDEPMSLQDLEMLATPFDEYLPKVNVVTLVGRVGNTPEPRYFDDGKVVLTISLAVKRKYHSLERKIRNIAYGEEETDWFPLEFWGRDAEYVTKYVEKGARLGITGSLAMDGWVDRMTGEQRRKAKILVRHIDILESRAEAELRKSKGGAGGADRENSSGRYGGGSYDDDDDGGPSPAGTGGFFS